MKQYNASHRLINYFRLAEIHLSMLSILPVIILMSLSLAFGSTPQLISSSCCKSPKSKKLIIYDPKLYNLKKE
jgi:hypothetical protein